MKKVFEYVFIVLVLLALIITFVADRVDVHNLEYRDVYTTFTKDSSSLVDSVINDIKILEKLESIDSIVELKNGTNINMSIKNKRYKDSIDLLKSNIKKDRILFEQEKELYIKQQEVYQQEVNFLQTEKENLNIKYKKEHELNQVYSNSISQMRDSLIYSDSLINFKKKPK